MGTSEAARRKAVMVTFPLERETATLHDYWAVVGTQYLVAIVIHFRRPEDYAPHTLLTLWENRKPVILETSDGLFVHFEETTSLGEGNPPIFLRISLRFCALNTKDMEEQIKSGNYSEISNNYLKGTKKRQRVWMKLRGR
jgi:hypothetical protein